MPSNPYAAPAALVEDRGPEGFTLAFSIVGMLIGTGAAYTLGLIYAGFAQLAFLWTGVELNDLYNAVATSPLHNAVSHVINVSAEALGGYWAAKLAPHRPIPHAVVAGFLMLIPAAAAFLVPYDFPHPAWSLALMFVTPVPAAVLGAMWWRRRNPPAAVLP